MEGQGWRPIDTAPFDVEILCAWYEEGGWHFHVDKQRRDPALWHWDPEDVAHWRPIPEPPDVPIPPPEMEG